MPLDQDSLIALLEQFYEANKDNLNVSWSWNNIARHLGVSPSTLNLWRTKNPKNSPEKMNLLVANFLQREQARKEAPVKIEFKYTKAAQMMLDSLNYAQVMNEFCVVISRAGYGKTETIREWKRLHPECLIIEGRATQQQHTLVYEIAEKLGVSVRNASDFIFKRIVDALKAAPRLLIFDEAQFYKYNTLETIRRIHDQSGCGIVLVGSYVLYDQMTGRKVKDYDQMLSRVIKRELPALDEDDVKLLIEEQYDGDLTGEMIRKMIDECNGSARLLVKNFKLARSMSGKKKVGLSEIKRAYEFLLAA